MKTIWKYEIDVYSGLATFPIPLSSRVVFVATQSPNVLTFWALVETNNLNEMREFKIFGTGSINDKGFEYMGSVVDGDFVWHLFENKNL